MFSFCFGTLCFKWLSMFSIVKYSISSEITFYSLNVVNFTRVVIVTLRFERNIPFSNILFHEMDRTIFLSDSTEWYLRNGRISEAWIYTKIEAFKSFHTHFWNIDILKNEHINLSYTRIWKHGRIQKWAHNIAFLSLYIFRNEYVLVLNLRHFDSVPFWLCGIHRFEYFLFRFENVFKVCLSV